MQNLCELILMHITEVMYLECNTSFILTSWVMKLRCASNNTIYGNNFFLLKLKCETSPTRSVMETPNTINLLTFDANEHRECRYILTSPRSLRACANLKIKVQD